MNEKTVNTLVVGGGPGGYSAAIRLGQLGVSTLLIEKGSLGGTCLNVGCIPSKALIGVSSKYYQAKNNWQEFGINCKPTIDWDKTINWKNKVVSKISAGVDYLLKANSVQVIKGSAKIVESNKATVDPSTTVNFQNLIIATGSTPIELTGFEFDHKLILDSTDLLALTKIPKSLIILGGGIIGIELGSIFCSLGSKVTIVEMLPNILPGYEAEAVQIVQKAFTEMGGTILTDHKAISYKKTGSGIQLNTEHKGKNIKHDAQLLAVAIGRKSNYEGLNINVLNLKMEANRLLVNDQLQTSLSHIYAIGDVIDGPMLAHKATKEGVLAAEAIAGHKVSRSDTKVIPDIVYTKPEIAQVGLSQKQAEDNNLPIKIGKFPFSALGLATVSLESKGYVKIIANKKNNRIIGATIVSYRAADMISELVLAIEMGATLDDISLSVHPHPTFGEAIMEAAAAGLSEAIHIVNKKNNS